MRTVELAQVFAALMPRAHLTLLDCGHSTPFERLAELAAVVRGQLDRLSMR